MAAGRLGRNFKFGKSVLMRGNVGSRFLSTSSIDILLGTEHEAPLSENDVFNSNFVNRNPRNLELMFLARKPSGFGLDFPSRNYWNKLLLNKSQRNITAIVVHNSGKVVVSASTSEWAVNKHLCSKTSLSAVENIGRVLAQRCLESGILFVHCDFTPEELATNRVQIFLKAMEEGGVTLKEPDQIRPRLHPDL